MSAIAELRDVLETLEHEAPWPGLAPIQSLDRAWQLKGRDQDSRDMLYEVRDHQLTVLMGETGVGKSSFLNVKILPRLRQEGFAVFVCREWGSAGSRIPDGEIGRFIAEKTGLPQWDDSLRADPFAGLDRRSVLVLDQFEELIRHTPELAEQVQAWIVSATQRYDVRILLSLRVEYEHRLRGLRIAPYQRVDVYLEPVDASAIREIVAEGFEGSAQPIDPKAEAAILEHWRIAGGNELWSGIGLPHLQALLAALWAGRGDADRITTESVERFFTHHSANAAFSAAVSVTARRAIDRAMAASDRLGDRFLVQGAAALVARMARHLSSAGYKVDQDRRHLMGLVLDEELAALGLTNEFVDHVFDRVAAAVDRERSATPHGAATDWTATPREAVLGERLSAYPVGSDVDREDVTSGPAMGLPPEYVLVEELRRYFLALEWLTAMSLIRQSAVGSRATRVALIHDAVGAGLNDWAAARQMSPDQALTALTAAVGRRYAFTDAISGGIGLPRTVVNLRWRACRITARFEHVVLLNCDFRETVFVDCTFEGVTFVNCLLDSVSFVDCSITGEIAGLLDDEAPVTPGAPDAAEPTFWWPAPEQASELVRYLELGSDGDGLRSGQGPAVPGPERATDLRVARSIGGLSIQGGRLSSLTFVRSTFGDDAVLALLHSAGTSVEFAEQRSGRVYLRDVAIRGFSVSPDRARALPAGPFDVRFYDCQAHNVWISPDMAGSAEFEESVAWQVFNAADRSDFAVRFSSGRFSGLVNTGEPEPAWREDRLDVEGLHGLRDGVRAVSARIDRRSAGRGSAASAEPTE